MTILLRCPNWQTTLILMLLCASDGLALGVQGSIASGWALGVNISDAGNQCSAAFDALVGISPSGGNLPVYYSSQAAAVADVATMYPQVYLDHVDPANPSQGLPAFYVYGLPNCPGQSLFGGVIFSFSLYYDTSVTSKPAAGPTGTSCPANASPTGVVARDVNRDGKPDLVESSYNGSIVTVLLNNGDGTFKVNAYPVDDGSGALALGDLNGDGLIDLVTVSSTAATVSVRLA